MRLPSRPCGNNPSQTPLRIAQNKPKTKNFAICNDFLPCNSESQKDSVTKHWHLITGKNTLALIYPQAPTGSYRKEKSLKDFLVRAKIPSLNNNILKELYMVTWLGSSDNIIRLKT